MAAYRTDHARGRDPRRAASRPEGTSRRALAHRSALSLQLHITPAAPTTLCLAAIVSDRRGAALHLAESQRREGERAAEERQRIARELHDSASQSLFATPLDLRTAERALAR